MNHVSIKESFVCQKCNWEWFPWKEHPANCPRCKSRKWQEPRVRGTYNSPEIQSRESVLVSLHTDVIQQRDKDLDTTPIKKKLKLD